MVEREDGGLVVVMVGRRGVEFFGGGGCTCCGGGGCTCCGGGGCTCCDGGGFRLWFGCHADVSLDF